MAWAASRSLTASGTGTTCAAGATTNSRQFAQTSGKTTRVPGLGPSTPAPNASTTPTHSTPGLVGKAGVRPKRPRITCKSAGCTGTAIRAQGCRQDRAQGGECRGYEEYPTVHPSAQRSSLSCLQCVLICDHWKRAVESRIADCSGQGRHAAGLARSRHQHVLQLLVEFTPDLGYALVSELVEQGGWQIVFKDRATLLVFVENDAQRRV